MAIAAQYFVTVVFMLAALSYIVNAEYSWKNSGAGQYLPCAGNSEISGGSDDNGYLIYVGRTHFSGGLYPSTVVPRKGKAFFSTNNKGHSSGSYEVLCGTNLRWVSSSNGYVPAGAVPGGYSIRGETLYIGRTHYEGGSAIGKVHPSEGLLYTPYYSSEIRHKNGYEILVS